MSAADKLRALDEALPPMSSRIDLMLGPAGYVDLCVALRNALPEIIAVVDAAERVRKNFTLDTEKRDHSAPKNLNQSLKALNAKLGEPA